MPSADRAGRRIRGLWILRIGPQLLIFYRNLLNLKLLFKNQKKLNLSSVFKWLDISKLKMPKLIDLCALPALKTHKEWDLKNKKGQTMPIKALFWPS